MAGKKRKTSSPPLAPPSGDFEQRALTVFDQEFNARTEALRVRLSEAEAERDGALKKAERESRANDEAQTKLGRVQDELVRVQGEAAGDIATLEAEKEQLISRFRDDAAELEHLRLCMAGAKDDKPRVLKLGGPVRVS